MSPAVVPVAITDYLKSAGTLEHAATMANHSSPRTTKIYGRRADEVSLDEYERVGDLTNVRSHDT